VPNMSALEGARQAIEAGFRVVRLGPLEVELGQLGASLPTLDPLLVESWFTDRPFANYALAMGTTSGFVGVEFRSDGMESAWSLAGMPTGARIVSPTGLRYQVFRSVANNGAFFEKRFGVRFLGSGTFVPGIGSILALGSVRGDIRQVPAVDFETMEHKLDAQEAGLPQFLSSAANLPRLTEDGEDFVELISQNAGERGDEENRRHLLNELQRTSLEREEMASVVWASSSGRALRKLQNGLDVLWEEVNAAAELGYVVNADHTSGPVLLTSAERTVAATTSWWGRDFVSWARGVLPPLYAELAGWNILSDYFGAEVAIAGANWAAQPRLEQGVLTDRGTGGVKAALAAVESFRALLGLRSGPTSSIQVVDIGDGRAKKRASGEIAWSLDVETYIRDSSDYQDRAASDDVARIVLASRLADARDVVRSHFDGKPIVITTSEDALTRQHQIDVTLREFNLTRQDRESLQALVSVAAAIVAISSGRGQVELPHVLIAGGYAEGWLASLQILRSSTPASIGPSLSYRNTAISSGDSERADGMKTSDAMGVR
jgi:hypothetical protein